MSNRVAEFIHSSLTRHAHEAHKPVVLVVDDEEPVRRFVARVLGQAGYETIVAEGGADAIALAGDLSHIDLVLTDLMMPGMGGDVLAARLRAKEPDMRVLYLTAYCDRLFVERMTLWENEAFLEKPCSVKGLLEAVSVALNGHPCQAAAGR